jgi:hypothetical protein
VVGRQAALVAALATAAAGVLAVSVLLCAVLPLTGLPAAGSALLALGIGCCGLAWRLQRGALAGWVAGYAFLFAICGAAAKGIGQLFGTSTALEREFARLGGQTAITNAYLAALMLLAGLVAAGYAISVILRLRAEETGGAAELVLATATGRVRWALSHIAVAGTALLLAVAGVATGLVHRGVQQNQPLLQAAPGPAPAADAGRRHRSRGRARPDRDPRPRSLD